MPGVLRCRLICLVTADLNDPTTAPIVRDFGPGPRRGDACVALSLALPVIIRTEKSGEACQHPYDEQYASKRVMSQ